MRIFEGVMFVNHWGSDHVTYRHHNVEWQGLQHMISHRLLHRNPMVSEGCLHLCKPQGWILGLKLWQLDGDRGK